MPKASNRCEICGTVHVVDSLAKDCCHEWKEDA